MARTVSIRSNCRRPSASSSASVAAGDDSVASAVAGVAGGVAALSGTLAKKPVS